ncbi:hypothetical protein Q7P36_001797 [Cladosporium allicinum]
MSGKWTAYGNAMGWPLAPAALRPEQAAEYIADMCAEFHRGELALAQAQAAPVSMHLPVSTPVHVASQQSVGSQMLPTQQVGAPIFIGNQQVYWNSAPFAGQTYAVAGPPQLMMPQAAPPAPQADQENWNSAPDAATPAQVGQNMFTAGPVAPPAPAPRAVQAHCAPSAVPACLPPQSQRAAPQMPIDLTGDGNEVVASAPVPQRAGTKRARADSTSGAAAPKVKKAKVEKPKVERPKVVKEKKEKKAPKPKKQPKIFMSGLRLPTVAAANIAPSDNSSVPFQGETMAMEQQQQPQYQQQQQQQQFLAGDATKIFYLADDTTANAPEMMRTDSANPMWGGEQQQQQQQQQDLSAAFTTDFSFDDADPIFEVQETLTTDFSFDDADTTSEVQETLTDTSKDQGRSEASQQATRAIYADYCAGKMDDVSVNLMDALEPGWRG